MAEAEEFAIGDVLVMTIVRSAVVISPICGTTDGLHARDTRHGAEHFCSFVAAQELV